MKTIVVKIDYYFSYTDGHDISKMYLDSFKYKTEQEALIAGEKYMQDNKLIGSIWVTAWPDRRRVK